VLTRPTSLLITLRVARGFTAPSAMQSVAFHGIELELPGDVQVYEARVRISEKLGVLGLEYEAYQFDIRRGAASLLELDKVFHPDARTTVQLHSPDRASDFAAAMSGHLLRPAMRNDVALCLAALVHAPFSELLFAGAGPRERISALVRASAAVRSRPPRGIPPDLAGDKIAVLAAIDARWEAFFSADEGLRRDREVLLAAARRGGARFLQRLSPEAHDRDVVLAAVAEDGAALEHAGPFRADDVVVLTAVLQSGTALRYADPELQRRYELALAAVRSDGLALRHVPPPLNGSADLMLAAVQSNGLALQYVSDALRDNRDVVLAAVRGDGLALKHASASLRDNLEVVLAAVRGDGLALKYASAGLRNTREVVTAAVSKDRAAIRFASGRLLRDRASPLLAGRGKRPREAAVAPWKRARTSLP
jgi:hypothetical protein